MASGPEGDVVDRLIDWDTAVRTASMLTRPGPQLSAGEASEAVGQLREAARTAIPHVARVSGLDAPSTGEALVVDRAGWTRANVRAFRAVLAPVVEEAANRRDKPLSAGVTGVGSRVTGAELGGLLAFLSARVLGQYDPFGGPVSDGHPAPGRLLLVAPNVVHIERELDVSPADFRLWVCLHEETHRVQFGATGWLADHLLAEVRALTGELLLDPGQVVDRLTGVLRSLPDALRGTGSGAGLLDAVQTPEQRARLANLTAVMSLLEGHADVIMDEVGPQVIPTVGQIRQRFTRRRAGRGAGDQLVRRLLGLEAKMRQYADGARFVRAVTASVGNEGLNAVWTGPGQLPTAAEIADPQAWVRRVHA